MQSLTIFYGFGNDGLYIARDQRSSHDGMRDARDGAHGVNLETPNSSLSPIAELQYARYAVHGACGCDLTLQSRTWCTQ